MARSNKMEKRHIADEIRRKTGLARVICSQIAMAAVENRVASLRNEWNSPSTTMQMVAQAVREVNGKALVIGPRGTIEL